MEILKVVLTYLLTLYLVVLIGCMILSWINVFVRPWYPPRFVKLGWAVELTRRGPVPSPSIVQ